MKSIRIFSAPRTMTAALAGILSAAAPAQAASPAETSGDDNPLELGIFGGVHLYEKDHGLGRATGDATGVSPDHGGIFGLRLSYNLNPWIGFEAEGAISPTRTRYDSTRDIVLAYRGQLIGTFLHSGPIRPFAVLGFGAMSAFPGTFNPSDGQRYPRYRDTDASFHAGVGAKIPVTDSIGVRLDARVLAPPAIFSSVASVGKETHFGGPDFEILVGGYMGFGAKAPAPAPTPVSAPAPAPVPTLAPVPTPTPTPVPVVERDSDSDGILDKDDTCPNEPETVNGYQDADGCPDELPNAVKKFTGSIDGITFKTNSADIGKSSYKVLDKAFTVLTDYPDVKLEIGGHTDNAGDPAHNKDLSQRRAESVKQYLVGKGVAEDRLTAVGYGMEKPLGPNKTSADRAKNRRTEFILLTGK